MRLETRLPRSGYWILFLALGWSWNGCPVVGWAQEPVFLRADFSPLSVGGQGTAPVIADVNGDGRADVVVGLENARAITVLLGGSDGGFQPAPGAPFPAGGLAFSLAVSDLDGDTRLDLVAVNRSDNQLTILRGDGVGGFQVHGKPIPTGVEPRAVRIADFNRDGKPDLVVANDGDRTVSILIGDGSGGFVSAPGSPVSVGRNPGGLTVADFNGDGALDVAVANRLDKSVSILLNKGVGGFTSDGLTLSVGAQPFDVTSADINHDGNIDLISGGMERQSGISLLGNGLGGFRQPGEASVLGFSSSPRTMVVADLNHDGHPDVVTAIGNESLVILLGTGDGSFRALGNPLYEPSNVGNTVAVGDLNGDGAPDLLQCCSERGLAVWLNTEPFPAIEISGAGVIYNARFGQSLFPEGTGPIRFTVRRRGSVESGRRFHVYYRLNGRATSRDEFGFDTTAAVRETDFVVPSTQGVLEFGPGVSERTVEVSLVNNAVLQGDRGMAFSIEYPSLAKVWHAEVIAMIREDERFLLRQQIALSPHAPLPERGGGQDVVLGLADGRFLVRRENALLRLTREGLPDLSFGRRDGWAILPSTAKEGGSPEFDRVLDDGRIQLSDSRGLIRITEAGIPDPSFGGGTGAIPLSGRVLDTASDGAILVATDDNLHIRRLLPSGVPDLEFSSTWSATQGIRWAKRGAHGRIWASTYSNELMLLGPDGMPNLFQSPYAGVTFLDGIAKQEWSNRKDFVPFDKEGRAYLRMVDPDRFGDPTQGMIVRFLSDGRYDATYRPLARGKRASLLDLGSDGTVLAVGEDLELVKIDSTGHARTLYSPAANIWKGNLLPDGAVMFSHFNCQGAMGAADFCTDYNPMVVFANGTMKRLEGSILWGAADRMSDGNRYARVSGDSSAADFDETDFPFYRLDTHFGEQRVGLPYTGRFVLESSASVILQRAGSSTNVATVRGRVLPLVAGRWDDQAAEPFEVRFQAGQAEFELKLPNLANAGRQSLREYLVRLESATGVELSDFTACRLWVLDDDSPPGTAELGLERFVGLDESHSALLVGRSVTRQTQPVSFSENIGLWNGQTTTGLGFTRLGPIWVKPVQTDGRPAGFLRVGK